jgi:hypothetical protein
MQGLIQLAGGKLLLCLCAAHVAGHVSHLGADRVEFFRE